MNTPNKLTLIRIFMTPLFLAALLITRIPHHYLIALVLFIGASLTDLFDGRLARKNDQITDFGKFLDPLADKLLVLAALVGFVQLGITDSWIVLIVLAREFLVTSLRLVALNGNGSVIAANVWGKVKTVMQMVAIITTLVVLEGMELFAFIPHNADKYMMLFCQILLWASAVMTFISGTVYLMENRKFIDYRK